MTTEQRASCATIPGVAHVGTHIGQAFLADETVGVNFGENWIAMSDSAPYDETRAAIEDTVAQLPGVFQNVETYLNERIDEVLAGSSEPIDVRIFGSDLEAHPPQGGRGAGTRSRSSTASTSPSSSSRRACRRWR